MDAGINPLYEKMMSDASAELDTRIVYGGMDCAICHGFIPIYDFHSLSNVWMCKECRERLFKVLYPERCKNDDA